MRVGVEARVAFRSRRLQQPFTLIESQRLRMDAVLIRYRTDSVGFWLTSHTIRNCRLSIADCQFEDLGCLVFRKSAFSNWQSESFKSHLHARVGRIQLRILA